MKAFMLFTGSGPLVVLTSHGSITAPGLLEKFAAKGIDKWMIDLIEGKDVEDPLFTGLDECTADNVDTCIAQ